MAVEKTLAIVKPDATAKKVVGKIVERIESEGLRIVAMRMIQMPPLQAEGFYAVHRSRPFFSSLVEFMCSGPSVVMILEGEGAIKRWREIMGATDPAKADAGTIRRLFGSNIQNNATHGSDAPETTAFETAWFFAGSERMKSELD